MTGRTLLLLVFPALLVLAGCQNPETASSAATPAPDLSGWRLASGKAPTEAEYAAITATCQAKGGAMDPCLTTLGLKKAR